MRGITEGEPNGLPPKAENAKEVTAELRKLSHDLKNALHGISLNLEVLRGRLSNELHTPFLENAITQLDSAAKLHQQYYDISMSLVQTKQS